VKTSHSILLLIGAVILNCAVLVGVVWLVVKTLRWMHVL
jgi:hypothetical protein